MTIRFLAACLITAAAFPALAQTNPAPSAGPGGFLSEMPQGAMRASEIMGVDVIGMDINQVGDIDDIVFDRQGNAVAVVIGAGGFLGVGQKSVAIPFANLQWNYDASPTSGPSGSNTGTATKDGTMQTQSAVSTPTGATPPETTGTVGDPSRPKDGLDVGKVATPVTSGGELKRATVQLTKDDLQKAPEFKTKNN